MDYCVSSSNFEFQFENLIEDRLLLGHYHPSSNSIFRNFKADRKFAGGVVAQLKDQRKHFSKMVKNVCWRTLCKHLTFLKILTNMLYSYTILLSQSMFNCCMLISVFLRNTYNGVYLHKTMSRNIQVRAGRF